MVFLYGMGDATTENREEMVTPKRPFVDIQGITHAMFTCLQNPPRGRVNKIKRRLPRGLTWLRV